MSSTTEIQTNEMNNDDQPPILRVDYRKLNEQCYICGKQAEVVRITHALGGEIYVSTLCGKHASGEQEHVMAPGDMMNLPGTGTFINKAMYEKLQSLDGDLRVALEDAIGIE